MTQDSEDDRGTQRPISPLAIIVVVIGGLNVLLGFTSLVDSALTIRDWFAEGILSHYERVRDWLFGWLPFSVPQWIKDTGVIYSGFVFWAARVLSAGSTVEVKFGTTSPLAAVISVVINSLAGPIVLIQHLQRPRNFAEDVTQILVRAGANPTGVATVEAFGKAYRSILRRSGRAMFWTAVFMAFGFVCILFIGTDLLDKWR